MKHTILYLPARQACLCAILLCCILFSQTARAQYVTIPDTTFVNWLNSHGFASCMNGNQLDTTCNAVLDSTIMLCYGVPIHNLTGIQYFKNLKSLDCSNDSLYFIPWLPPLITAFHCQYNNLDSLPDLPSGLQILECYNNRIVHLPVLPAPLLILSCTANQLTSLPGLPLSLNQLYCANNQLISLPALPDSLTYLDCSQNQVTSLPSLPGLLIGLDCWSNQLIGLPTLSPALGILSCSGNMITSLPPLPDSLHSLYCSQNQLTILPPLPPALNNLWCYQNQLNSLPSLPGTLVYLELSTNQVTSLPALPAGLGTLHCAWNKLTSLPVLPAALTDLICSYNQLTDIPPLPDSLNYFGCDYNPNLSCLPELKRIVDMYFTGTSITCLPDYGIITTSTPPLDSVPLCGIFNPNGCQVFWNISGQCFYSPDGSCAFDSGSVGSNYVKTQLYNGGTLVQQTFTGGNGYYSFDSVSNGNYTIQTDTSNLPFTVECPASSIYDDTLSAIDSLIYNNNFAFICRTAGFDLGAQSVIDWYFPPRPNKTFTLSTLAGDMSELYGAHCATGISGSVQITYSGPLTYLGPAGGALTPTLVSGDTITWNIADYGTVNDFTAFNLRFKIDSLAVPGTPVCFTINVTPLTGDYNPSNNSLTYCFPVVASLDPNEKEVYPATVDTGGWLAYAIRFQNTGTAPAANIRVTDTLDNNLDPSTFQLLTYSAKNLTQIFGNVVVFNFPNINLPDSATSDSASRGFVQYKIKLKSGVAQATTISNTASIYFDLNSPVVTNTAISTVGTAAGIMPISTGNEFSLNIYPNPANNLLYIKVEGILPQTISIYDVNGQKVNATRFMPQVDISNLTPGVYLLEVTAPEGTARKRFVKM